MKNKIRPINVVILFISLVAIQIACGQTKEIVIVRPLDLKETNTNGTNVKSDFGNPQLVTILGYEGNAMEPFISKDDQYLFFNNLNSNQVDTNLHYASRVDGLTFQYQGEISGVNSELLDAVASMDSAGSFYFISLRNYFETYSTIFRGHFNDGNITNVELVKELSLNRPGFVNFDAEISSDGLTIYFVDGQFKDSNIPEKASLVIARKIGDTFERSAISEEIFKNINTAALEYAPAISSDGLELFFTRLDQDLSAPPAIYRAVRNSPNEPFGIPEEIIGGPEIVEAATLSSDENELYYHKKENDRFVIYRLTR